MIKMNCYQIAKRKIDRVLAKAGLYLIHFGLSIYDSQPFGLLDEKDKDNILKLEAYRDKFIKWTNR